MADDSEAGNSIALSDWTKEYSAHNQSEPLKEKTKLVLCFFINGYAQLKAGGNLYICKLNCMSFCL